MFVGQARSLPPRVRLFRDFRTVAGLHLNIRKTVLVPLSLRDRDALADDIMLQFPDWAGIQVKDRAKYLGFVLGPGKGDSSFDKALRKYQDRALLRGGAPGAVPGD